MTAARLPPRSSRTALLVIAACVTGLTTVLADAPPETLAAWHEYVRRVTPHENDLAVGAVDGASVDVPGGTIHRWRAATVVDGTRVDGVVDALMYPGTPPPQEDVIASRVLARDGNRLRVYLRLSRSVLVTAVYDTEHDVAFTRPSPQMAESRSVSVRIEEVGGADRGFLWKLNSYWRYSQTGRGVRIELESVSLSRDIPWFARAIAAPIANRIARESVERTMDAVQRFLGAGAARG